MKPERLFGLLSDPTRLRTLLLIAAEDELCVCELTCALQESQPKVSRHLALLRREGVLIARREGTWMHYGLKRDIASWAMNMITATADQLGQLERFRADRKRLQQLAERPEGRNCA